MTLSLQRTNGGRVFLLRPYGRMTKEDYQQLEPALSQAVEDHGVIDVLLDLRDFEGASPGAVWEDVKLEVSYLRKVGRIAVIGDAKWQEWAARLTEFVSSAEVRHFGDDEESAARRFLGVPTGA